MKKKTWKILPDERIHQFWKCETRRCKKDICFVLPSFYQEAGTPVCEKCGNDMVYRNTEVQI